MAYSTGTGAGPADLLAAINTFATANCGFSNNQGGGGADYLQLSNGVCNIAMQAFTRSENDYGTGSNVPFTDHQIRMALATAFGTTTNYYGHPGSDVTSASDRNRVECNGLGGPYVTWHLFGDPGYCHVVVQVTALRYAHISFGLVDQGDLTHGGVAYVSGSAGYFTAQDDDLRPLSAKFNGLDQGSTGSPFPFLAGPNVASYTSSYGRGCKILVSDALPTANLIFNKIGPNFDDDCLVNLGKFMDSLTDQKGYNAMGNRICRALPTAFGNRSILFPMPVMAASSLQVRYLGRMPDVRYINMSGLSAGEDITFGGETWTVFPIMQQGAFGSAGGNAPNTLQYGLAYKKIL